MLLIFTACHSEHVGTVTDIDGNIYRTITIGNQVWMADNLEVTHYRNGDTIPCITDTAAWSSLSSGAHCYYNNDIKNIAGYGRLYNWHAISDSRGIAPEGWHIPDDEEIATMINSLGGDTISAGKMKEGGTAHWLIPNEGAANESGFSALPGGYRFNNGSYHTMGSNGYWWSATRSYEMYAWSPRLYAGFADVRREPYYQQYGFAVRCIKDAGKKVKEEQVVEGFDHSLNRINKAHYYYPHIDGNGLTVSVKEDLFDVSDIDFKGRYLPVSLASDKVSAHANMMATLIGGGGNSFYTGTGVAKASMLSSSSFRNLLADGDAFYSSHSITVQNHSYGTGIESFYGADAVSYDRNVLQQPQMVHVFSSGNSGASASSTGVYRDITGFANLTGSFKMAKNSIVVAAIDSFANSIEYISRGPAYDGRLKPELSACTNGGSSGAAALVSGSALLLQQLYRQKFSQLPDAALVKAILINSADDAGSKGIDFSTGFGSLNLYKALGLTEQERFFSGSVQSNGSRSFTISVPDRVKQLKLTLCWTDPPAMVNSATALVNDLDLTLTHAGGQQWLPWVLNTFPHSDSLQLPAVRKRDNLNTTEQISIDDPAAGNYEIRVSANGITGSQRFYVAWQYDKKDEFSWDYPVATDNLLPSQNSIIRWSNSFNATGTLQWTANGSQWETIDPQTDLSRNYAAWLVPDTVTTAQLRMVIGSTIFLSDTFTISKPLSVSIGYNCKDSVQLSWERQKNVSSYKVYSLGNKYLEPVMVTTDTMIRLTSTAYWFSVVPVLANGRQGVRSIAINYDNFGPDCLANDKYLVFPNPALSGQPMTLVSSAVMDNDVFLLYTTDGKLLLQKRLSGIRSSITVNGLTQGIYLYVIVNSGSRKYAGKIFIR